VSSPFLVLLFNSVVTCPHSRDHLFSHMAFHYVWPPLQRVVPFLPSSRIACTSAKWVDTGALLSRWLDFILI
jgi:hypothetical protein